MWGFVVSVAEKAAGFFFGGASSVTDTTVKDAVIGLYAGLQSLANFLQTLLGYEKTAWDKAGPQVVAGGRGLGNLAFNELFAWTRLLHTILPGSLSWLWGFVWRWGTPKFQRIWRYLAVLNRRVSFLLRWRLGYVNPTLAEWTRFRRFYFTWPNRTVRRVHDWFQRPRLFAEWATPVLVPSVLQWLASRKHRPQRDDLARIIVGAVADMPDQVGWAVYRVLDGPLSK